MVLWVALMTMQCQGFIRDEWYRRGLLLVERQPDRKQLTGRGLPSAAFFTSPEVLHRYGFDPHDFSLTIQGGAVHELTGPGEFEMACLSWSRERLRRNSSSVICTAMQYRWQRSWTLGSSVTLATKDYRTSRSKTVVTDARA